MEEAMANAGPDLFWIVVVLACLTAMELVWLFFGLIENRRLRSELNTLTKLREEELKIVNDLKARNDYLSGRIKELDDALHRYRSPRDNIGAKVPPATTGDPGDENKIIEDSIGQYGPGGRGFGF